MVLSDADRRLFGLDESEQWLQHLRTSGAREVLGDLGAFELIEEVGRGGQGVVFRARQPGTGRQIALKRMHGGLFATPAQLGRFRREVQAAAALQHPGVVTVFGADDVDGLPVLAMEWIDGTPIDAWARAIGTSAAARRRVLDTFVALCSAVQHAHQRGILHRDLKPSNVLVDAEGRPHVLDFGLARLLSPPEGEALVQTHTDGFVGTPLYASPEHFSDGDAVVDLRSEIGSASCRESG